MAPPPPYDVLGFMANNSDEHVVLQNEVGNQTWF